MVLATTLMLALTGCTNPFAKKPEVQEEKPTAIVEKTQINDSKQKEKEDNAQSKEISRSVTIRHYPSSIPGQKSVEYIYSNTDETYNDITPSVTYEVTPSKVENKAEVSKPNTNSHTPSGDTKNTDEITDDSNSGNQSSDIKNPVEDPKIEEISPEVKELLNKIELATIRVNSAKELVAEYEGKLSDAQRIYNEAVTALADLKNTVDTLTISLESAKSELTDATANYEAILASAETSDEFAALKKDVEDKTIALAGAMDARDNALLAVADAKANYEDTLAIQNEKIAAVEDAETVKADAEKMLADAEAELEQAQKDLRWKIFNRDEAKQVVNDAKDAVATAQTDYNNAVSALEAAKSEVVNTQVDLNAYKKAVEDAEKAVVDAQAQIALGSYGFFSEYANEDSHALTILTMVVDYQNTEQYINDAKAVKPKITDELLENAKTTIGNEKDATSLENMKKAIAMIREGNELRTTDDNFTGLNELLVTDAMMASAQVNANASYDIEAHWSWLRNNGYNTGENTAAGWGDPYDGWYGYEKQVYEYLEDHPELDETNLSDRRTIAKALNLPTEYIQVGHYENLIYNRYQITGYAIDTKARGTQTQNFNFYSGLWKKDTAYTVDEYEARFMEYYNKVYAALSDAEAKRDAAKAELERIETTMSLASDEHTQKIADAQYAVAIAEKAVMDAQDDLSKAEATLIQKEAEVTTQETLVSDKSNDVTDAGTAVSNATDKVDTAKAELSDATYNVTVAEGEVKDAEDLVVVAEKDVTAKTEELDDANKAVDNYIDTMDSEVKDAKDAVDQAEGKVSDAQDAVNKAEADVTTQETVVNDSMEALAQAEESVNYAQEKLDEAYVELGNAETEKANL